ncbi:MAG: hypothetical protein GY761_10310, partial [Hyphomicrobiales bacterium]|nr:hypothetical protein [Hyphomicrobiales bacterium]
GYGRDAGKYWKRKFPIGDLESMWPNAVIDEKTRQRISKDQYEEVEVYQVVEFNPTTKMWDFSVFMTDGEGYIHQSSTPYSNWLSTAFYKVPGEAKGRGPGMTALGPIKVANKLQELILKNAAFATLGIWTHRDDGVFRRENAPIVPGAWWKVQANGGPFGPSIMRQPMNDRFDVSMLVLSEIQTQIKQATFDDTLPPDTAAVRSATEIIERMKRLAQDWAGAYSRLQRDFLRPLIQWNIWVAHKNKTLPATFNIDEMLVSLEIISPIARGDQASAVENEVKWLELLLNLFGQEAMMLMAKVEQVGPDWGRKLGVSENLIRSEEDKAAMQQAMAQIMAAQQQQAAGQEAPAPA